jgi:DNA-directed RNA polymerase specialized sigma24 family protein
MGKRKNIMITGSLCIECEKRLVNLHNESYNWLIQSANKITKNKIESEDLVQELYEYLHLKCNPKLFWGKHSYNLFYCSKFLHSRFINKTKKLNRTTYVEEVWDTEIDKPYDVEYDEKLQKAHDEVITAINDLKKTKQFASAMIWEMYYMSDDTLDEVAHKIGISKSTTFLAVRKVRRILSEMIDNPFEK